MHRSNQTYFVITGFLVLIQVFIILFYYPPLPAIVPMDFGLMGYREEYGPKFLLLIPFFLSLLIISFLFYQQRLKADWKVNWPIRPDKKESLQPVVRRVSLFLMTWITGVLTCVLLFGFFFNSKPIDGKVLVIMVILFIITNLTVVLWSIMQIQKSNSIYIKKL